MTPCIETYSGLFVNPLDLKPTDVCLEDVAHALSMKTRFTGHAQRFCSIAEHSVNVSRLIDPMPNGYFNWGQMVALFHEGDEVYLPDIASPIKYNPVFDAFRPCAKQAQKAVFDAFMPERYPHEYGSIVQQADLLMLAAEAEKLLPQYRAGKEWEYVRLFASQNETLMKKARKFTVDSPPAKAERKFLLRYREIQGVSISWWDRLRAA